MSALSRASLVCAAASAFGCDGAAVVAYVEAPVSTTTADAGIPRIEPAGVDLLLMIDNSRSMASKQEVLGASVVDLVGRLVNPRCIDEAGQLGSPETQPGPVEPCPTGYHREFAPVTDLHVGVISSSLGGHGSDACPADLGGTCSSHSTTNDDHAHLLVRRRPCGVQEDVPTYQGKGFLAWDPRGELAPPGIAGVDELVVGLHDLVTGVGQWGCGFEAPLESVYRFLVDPAPYLTITAAAGEATPSGVDGVLLQQRRDFLRPDSLLAVVMLTDENDCSIVDGGQYFYAAQIKNGDGSAFHLPRPRSECAADPDATCCGSCGEQDVTNTCGPDPSCGTLTELEDNINVRCFDQKRRFGIDFLYPTKRYVNAMTRPVVDPTVPDLESEGGVANPLFSDLDPSDARDRIRDPGLVFVLGIVGVPWQPLVRVPGELAKGLKSAAELEAKGPDGRSTWDLVLGDPDARIPPADPHMVESIEPRAGLSTTGGDPITVHERQLSKRDDLQFACVYSLQTPIDCAQPTPPDVFCECPNGAPGGDPRCAAGPSGEDQPVQIRAAAYPGLRQLAVLRGLGAQGVVASICAETVDPSATSFGYRPAMVALVEALVTRLPR